MGPSLRERNRSANVDAIRAVALDQMGRSGFGGVTIEQIDAKYDPRIAELNRAYGDAMRAIAIFNGYRDEFPDEA